MRRLAFLLAIAIISLVLFFFLFNSEQYFSAIAMLGIILIGILTALLFILPHTYPLAINNLKKPSILLVAVLLLIILIVYEYLFSGVPGLDFLQFLFLIIATSITIFGLYLFGKVVEGKSLAKDIVIVVVGALIITYLVYQILSGILGPTKGLGDGLAFNYYATMLFLQGQNPYIANMAPALSLFNVLPTPLINGQIVTKYIYPPFSLLIFALPVYLLHPGLSFFFSISIFLTILSAWIVYYKSGKNKFVLIPLTIWIVLSYFWVGDVTEYFAISLLFVLAYTTRENPKYSGIFAGLAASTTQLAWFAIPFLFILVFREGGKKQAYELGIAFLATLIIANIYFILTSPQMIPGIFGAFLPTVPTGPSLMQLLITHYPVSYSFSMFVTVIFFALLLIVFYLYTETLKPLLAVAPWIIFIFSWRNSLIYALPFVPLILAVYYEPTRKLVNDISRSKIIIAYGFGIFAVLGTIGLLIAHNAYLSSNKLEINNVYLLINQTNKSMLQGFVVNMSNSGNTTENVSFYIGTRNPNEFTQIPGYELKGIPPFSSRGYAVDFISPYTQNSTLFVLAFSNDSVASGVWPLSLR